MPSNRYSIPLGDNGGEFSHVYTLYVSAEPDLNDPERFAVTLFFDVLHGDGSEERHEVARIDNKSHGAVHFDRLFEEGEPKDFGIDWNVHEAAAHLKQNWRKYARRYEKNRGRRGKR